MARPRAPDDPWLGLLPPLAAPSSLRAWPALLAALFVTAGIVLWPIPMRLLDGLPGSSGHPDVPGALTIWAVVARNGWGLVDLAGVPDANFPLGEDAVTRAGYPLDAVLVLPLVDLLGWPGWFNGGRWAWLFAAGASGAWLAWRWWGSPWAALVAGVTWQASSAVALEVSEGRAVLLAVMAFLPLSLGLWLRALDRGTWGAAVLAGLALAGLQLTWWFGVLLFGVGAIPALLVTLAARRWRAAWTATLGGAITAVAVCWGPLVWTLGRLHLQAGAVGQETGLYLDHGQWWTAWEMTQPRGLAGVMQSETRAAWPPLLSVAAAALGAWGTTSRRRVLLPLVLTLGGVMFALGPYVEIAGHPVFLPYAATLSLPGLGRMWWPLRYFPIAELGIALLAGGLGAAVAARSRVGAVALAGLLLGAAMVHSRRPLPMFDWPAEVETLSAALGDGPVLGLPYPGADGGRARSVLLHQVVHGRPLAMGRLAPGIQSVSDPVTAELHEDHPALEALARLGEADAPTLDAEALASLRGLGISSFYVDMEACRAPDGARILKRVRALEPITGPQQVVAEKFLVVPLPPARPDAATTSAPPP